jgi:ElaB/YqjD/DUF883 family membrane-anchored ribosome-binding protein
MNPSKRRASRLAGEDGRDCRISGAVLPVSWLTDGPVSCTWIDAIDLFREGAPLMAVATVETQDTVQPPTVKDRIVDAVRRVAHVSHEVRLAKSVARGTIEDGVYAAKRALKRVQRGVETMEYVKDGTARYVKRQPFTALGIAAGVGVLVGACVGWFSTRRR